MTSPNRSYLSMTRQWLHNIQVQSDVLTVLYLANQMSFKHGFELGFTWNWVGTSVVSSPYDFNVWISLQCWDFCDILWTWNWDAPKYVCVCARASEVFPPKARGIWTSLGHNRAKIFQKQQILDLIIYPFVSFSLSIDCELLREKGCTIFMFLFLIGPAILLIS